MAVPAANRGELVPSHFRALLLLPCHRGSLAPTHVVGYNAARRLSNCWVARATATLPDHRDSWAPLRSGGYEFILQESHQF